MPQVFTIIRDTSLQLMQMQHAHEAYNILETALRTVLPAGQFLLLKADAEQRYFTIHRHEGMHQQWEAVSNYLELDPAKYRIEIRQFMRRGWFNENQGKIVAVPVLMS